jgi:hypothetical protein
VLRELGMETIQTEIDTGHDLAHEEGLGLSR